MSSKKRRHEPENDERSLHQSFAAAANALTQFYVSAERENKRNKAEFARQMLVSLSCTDTSFATSTLRSS